MNNLVGDVKANPRDFYRYINSQKKDAQGIPPLKKWQGSGKKPREFYRYINSQKKDAQGIPLPLKKRQGSGLDQSDFGKASKFIGHFTDVFSKTEHSQDPLLDRSAPFIGVIVVTKEGVTKLLKGLNPSKALGHDELHPSPKENGTRVMPSICPSSPTIDS